MQSLNRILRIARATAHAACGWVAYRLGWHGASRRQFERVLLLRGADFRAYVHLGRIAFDHGDYAGWRREFEHARRTDPIRFARLRHPIELFEPRLAGTQFEGSTELEGFEAADSRATWRALHPHQDPRTFDPGQPGPGDHDPLAGLDPLGEGKSFGNGLIHGSPHPNDNRIPDGYGRGTDLPLAPGYDPLTSDPLTSDPVTSDPLTSDPLTSGQPDGSEPEATTPESHHDGCDTGADPLGIDPLGIDPLDSLLDPHKTGDTPPGSDGPPDRFDAHDPRHPSWQTPDASLSRDDFSSAMERRRFQLRRAIDSQEISRCDLNELARRLSS